jgi:dihydrofolate reductase
MAPFARAIDAAKKYVVSSTLDRVDWNAELVRGDLAKAVRQLKRESGKGLFVGGVKLPLALAELGLIDEYEFVVHPRLAGHGPTLFAGLSKHIDLKLVSRLEFGSGRWRCGMSLEGSHRLSARFASKTTRLEKGLRDAVSDDELLVMAGITHQRPPAPGASSKEVAFLHRAADRSIRCSTGDQRTGRGIRSQIGDQGCVRIGAPSQCVLHGREAADEKLIVIGLKDHADVTIGVGDVHAEWIGRIQAPGAFQYPQYIARGAS